MPANPDRASQGGDVEGMKPIDLYNGQGEAIKVSAASFDPGYDIDATLSDAGIRISKADVVRGFCTYGKAVGENE